MILLTLAVTNLTACRHEASIDPAAVQRIREQSMVDEARFGALISNRGAYEADLSLKYPRIWEGLQIERQIPTRPERSELESAIVTHARSLGMQAQVTFASTDALKPKLPEHVGPDEAIPWSDETLLLTLRLTITLTPSDLGLAERWFDTRGQIGRRLEISSLRVSSKRVEIKARAFAFRDDLPLPRREHPPFDFETFARAAGLPPPPRERAPRIAQAKVRYERLERDRAKIDEALQLRTRAERLDERYQRFVEITARCEAQRWLDVLR